MISKAEQQLYARVILAVGTALKRGQPLFAEIPVGQETFAEILAQEAYAMGCPDVGILWRSAKVDRARIAAGAASDVENAAALAEQYAKKGAAYLRLESPDFGAYTGLSPEALAKKAVEDAKPREIFRRKAAGCGSTLACIPGNAWAEAVFPELQREQRLDALWEAVLYCTRCREADPIAAWNDYLERTAAKKAALDKKGYTAFHYFDGCGTDLTVEPAQDFWKGSCVRTENRVSVPNIPTEEIFLTPHKYRVEGTVHSTLPLNYKGTLIEGIRLELRSGRIVDYSADRGGEVLRSIIETDEGSHHLGEMALVDQKSPLAQQGRIFYTTLFDENASCHFAIGNAIGPVRDPEERERRGMNTSSVHVDFMVGSDRLCIDGRLPDGSWESVFVNGSWA